jgi:hypothetical protein
LSELPGPTGQAAEYLEKIVADGFRRELDQEVNVVRSLPFFATSLGVLVAFLGLAMPLLPPLAAEPVAVAAYASLAVVVASLALLLFFLFDSIRVKRFEYPSDELALRGYARRLTAYYAQCTVDGHPPAPDVVAGAVLDDLRATVTGQLAEAARVSRRNNAERLQACARAFSTLILAQGFALLLVCLILARRALDGDADGEAVRPGAAAPGEHDPGSRDQPGAGEAPGPGDARGREGRVDLPRSSARRPPGQGRRATSGGRGHDALVCGRPSSHLRCRLFAATEQQR